MTAGQWQSCWAIYHEAQGLQASSRKAFVESSSSDLEVIEEVCTLLSLNADGHAGETAAATSPRAGAIIGKYEVGSLLGAGGMGEVYSARDTVLGRPVAIKFLRPVSLGDPVAVKRFVGEARAASALNHPNIVTVYEVIPSDFGLAIAMELVDGKSLREYAAGLDAADVIHCSRQIALALDAAHTAGIVHRDIKPENIFLRPDGIVKVLDFGLARELPRADIGGVNSTAGLPEGTLKYMSPEQLRGERVTSASDIFSLGLLMYELSAGEHPFASAQLWEVAGAIANADPVRPSRRKATVPEHLDRLILAMLAKNPAQRPTAADVASVLAGEQAAPRFARIRKGRRLWWVAAAAAVGLGAIAAISLLWKTPQEPAFQDLTTNAEGNPVRAAGLSPDGKRFAYADASGLFLRDAVVGSSANPLSAPKDLRIERILWGRNGRFLVVWGVHTDTGQPSIWSVDPGGAAPRLIRQGAQEGTPSPDGTRIAFTNSDTGDLLVAPFAGGEARKIASWSANNFIALAWSADGNRIGYSKVRGPAVYEWVDVTTHQVTASLRQTLADSAMMLADGTFMLLRVTGSSNRNVEIYDLDSRTGVQRGAPRQITHLIGNQLTQLSASSDGRRVLVLQGFAQAEIFVADFDAKSLRLQNTVRLTFEKNADYPHAWTPDSKSVIFESSRGAGQYDLYRQTVGDPIATAYSPGPPQKALAQLTPDGRWILFFGWTNSQDEPALYRMPAAGGVSIPVPIGGGPLDSFRCSPAGGRRCVLRTLDHGDFVFWELDPESGKGRELVRVPGAAPMRGDWALSSSGTEIAIPVHSSRDARLRVFAVEGPRKGVERIVELPGQHDLGAIAYRADDKGWFAGVKSARGSQLLHVGLTGKTHYLAGMVLYLRGGNIGELMFAVPSPDGRHVAFVDYIHEANVMILDR